MSTCFPVTIRGAEFRTPEVVVPGKANLPPHEHDLFILDGDKTLKVFKGGGSIKFRLFQTVNLEPGIYKLTLPIYADLVKGYTNDGQKIWADDPAKRDGLYKFLIDGPTTAEWQSLNPGAWNNPTTVVNIVNAGPVTLGIEIMLPFPLAQNGIFADAWALELVEEEPGPGDPVIHDIVNDLITHPTKEYDSRSITDVTTIVVHHTTGDPFQPINNIANYHVNTKGWPGIGYHFVIDGAGKIHQTNYLTTHSFHANLANAYSVGVCMQGDFTNHPPPFDRDWETK